MSAKKAAAKAPAKDIEPKAAPATGKKVEVRHISRVEGHGNIIVEIDAKNKVKACRWEVPEAPRFFEAMILGKSFTQVHQIVSRICGICSIGHQLCSIQTTEDAMGIMVSDQTVRLRKLALHGENLQSHLLHVAYLALPDLMGVGSVIPLAQTHKNELLNLIGLHRMANEFSRATTGRTTHPQRLIPGGFTKVPSEVELREIKKMLEDSISGLEAASDLFAAVAHKLPDFTRETEYVGLVSPVEYAMYWGEVGSTMDQTRPSIYYKDITNEYMVAQSTAKWTKNKGESLMVGALARFNLNHKRLSPLAKGIARKLGLKAPCHNPYYNNLAQLVECAHSVEDSIRLTDELLTAGIKHEAEPHIIPRAGKGVGAVEVPRGILFHAYEYDDRGRIVNADCVIPTNQNHGNIQKDFDALVPTLVNEDEAGIELKTSMLVRAYDPCISCSTHFVDMTCARDRKLVQFVRVDD